jgi:hypothetical protein
VTTVVTLPQYAHLFGPNGGEWAHQYGVTLTVPPQAVTETTRFQFAPCRTPRSSAAAGADVGPSGV